MNITYEQAERVNLKDELAPLRRLKEAHIRGDADALDHEHERLFNEELTDIAEAIDHLYLESRFEYDFDGRQVVLPDGTALSDIYRRGVATSEHLAKRRPVYQFEYQRRQAEARNQDLIDAMMRGEVEANTVVEWSPFPEEVALTTLPEQMEDLGYKPMLKRGMVRIARKEENGRLSLTTFSLDNSNLESFQSMQQVLEQTPNQTTTDMLANPALLNSDQAPSQLIETLIRIYDKQLGSDYYRGRKGVAGNSLTYVTDSKPIVDFYFSQLETLGRDWAQESISPQLATVMKEMINWQETADNKKLLPHDIQTQLRQALTLRRLDEQSVGIIKRALEIGAWASIVKNLNQTKQHFISETTISGLLTNAHEAEAAGQRMVGCGGATSLFTVGRSAAMEKVFGGLFRLEASYSFNRLMYCVVHQKPPKVDPKTKKAESRTWCGPCGICRGCDSRLKKKR